MKQTWLLLDCPYLCYRAHYSTGGLSHNGIPTGVLYGFFQSLMQIQDILSVSRMAFCFDSKKSKRKKMYPDYKANRKHSDDAKEVAEQISTLRKRVLPELGYKNVFCRKGYEADDLIAGLVHQQVGNEIGEAVIVSTDKDLYQLVRHPDVWMWNPRTKEAITEETIKAEHGIGPKDWPFVKALAGCKSDNVAGIPGVGEITAVKYLTGRCRESVVRKIKEQGQRVLDRNLPLVTLPLNGVGTFELVEDDVTTKKWRKFCEDYGMESLIRLNPNGRLSI